MIDSKILAQSLMKLSESDTDEKSVNGFFEYLKKKNLTGLLPQIKKHLIRQKESSSVLHTLVIASKHDISKSDIENIKSMIGADNSVLVELIKDESIIGGFSATYDGNIYDGSLRNQITQLRNRLTHS
jgi:F0F1-type ATP synthase delta subunit